MTAKRRHRAIEKAEKKLEEHENYKEYINAIRFGRYD